MIKSHSKQILPLGFLLLLFTFCTKEASKHSSNTVDGIVTIFDQLSSQESGVSFSNNLKEDSVINYFTYPYIYMGGGVAIGDVNNDGLQDIYFTGNMVENKLYLNKGDMQFEDITASAQVGGDDRWVTGVTMADVNADGWLDIYVSVSGKFATNKNLLYLNNGAAEGGIPTFTEGAEAAGIADEGRSTQGVFFDYDKDGDLDLYVANYPFTSFKTPNYSYQILIQRKDPTKSDKLYRNKGDGTFEDVSAAAGILNFGLSLSATVADYNNDGWEDIYVSNDFATPDYFYFNNGDGTFTDRVKETTQHIAFFGMGADAGDFNNDGLMDLVQMDMTPEDNRRNKANMASMNPAGFWEIVNMGMHYQYMQNVLQLNNGISTEDGLPHYSDISRLAGLSSTDWSWASLLADLDNDGWKDIFITNGTRRDINNKDYFNKIEKADYKTKQTFNQLDLTKNMPSEKVDNYAFKNNGDLTFTNVIKEWGLSGVGFSNGAAYGDLDNDGDLDMVVNNIDEPAAIYQNKTTDLELANYLRISLKGSSKNLHGLGAKIRIKNGDDIQYQQHTMTRGFQSSVEPFVHFGLGQKDVVEELEVTWPDGKQQILRNIPANQIISLDYQNAVDISTHSIVKKEGLFSDYSQASRINFKHHENSFDDFEFQVLLPHIYSRNGSGVAVGDVDGDGLEDFFVGNAIGSSSALYMQKTDGTFESTGDEFWKADADKEDMGATFFDADGDGDLDLYVISGGNEYEPDSPKLQDRLYLNDGEGNFEKSPNALPEMLTSGSRVKAADFDKDGDLDLFVGGWIVPRSYPLPAKSYILRNEGLTADGLKFEDVTAEIAPDLVEAGLVTDAVWVDYDQDSALDLVIVGEWMPITFLKNSGGTFVNKTTDYGLEKSTGWWYSIIAEDFDQDGDMDLVAGNLGLNYKYQATPEESFDVYVKDYDNNNHLDIVLGYYHQGVQYPVRGRQCSSEQIPAIKVKYKDYNSFAEADLIDIYTKEDLEASLHYQAWDFSSSYIENKGNGQFEFKKLPNQAQLSSINDIIAEDFNQDGHLDIVIAGNMFGSEVETPRNDASYGLLLTGDGKGNFQPMPFFESGFFLGYDTKDLARLNTPDGLIILALNNDDYLKVLKMEQRVE